MDKRYVGQDGQETVYDASTGEVYEQAVLAVFFPKRKNGFREEWVAMAQSPMMMIAKAKIGEQAKSVCLALFSKVDFENFILINQNEIAKELDMDRTNVSKAIGKLLEMGVIIKGPKVGRSSTYRLNPEFGWKGSAKNHKEALMEQMKGRGMSVIEGGKSETENPA